MGNDKSTPYIVYGSVQYKPTDKFHSRKNDLADVFVFPFGSLYWYFILSFFLSFFFWWWGHNFKIDVGTEHIWWIIRLKWDLYLWKSTLEMNIGLSLQLIPFLYNMYRLLKVNDCNAMPWLFFYRALKIIKPIMGFNSKGSHGNVISVFLKENNGAKA